MRGWIVESLEPIARAVVDPDMSLRVPFTDELDGSRLGGGKSLDDLRAAEIAAVDDEGGTGSERGARTELRVLEEVEVVIILRRLLTNEVPSE